MHFEIFYPPRSSKMWYISTNPDSLRLFITPMKTNFCTCSKNSINKVMFFFQHSSYFLNVTRVLVGSMEAPSEAFLLFFLLPDWLKLNHLKSRMECGFSDIFSHHICSTVAETIGVTNNTAKFWCKKMFRKPHFKMLR